MSGEAFYLPVVNRCPVMLTDGGSLCFLSLHQMHVGRLIAWCKTTRVVIQQSYPRAGVSSDHITALLSSF